MNRWIVLGLALAGLAAVTAWTVGCGPKPQPAAGPSGVSTRPAPATNAAKADDELATCPVTGETAKKSQMTPYEYKGHTYYLCCVPECLDKVMQDPEKYLKPPTTALVQADDELATCPVTGETAKKSQMTPYEYKGHTYYLCCVPQCLDKVKKDPEKYLKSPGSGSH